MRRKYNASVILDLLFNFVLSAVILIMLYVVPTTYVIEGYLNIGIYVAPYFYEELVTMEKEVEIIKIIKIFSFIVIIFYCFACTIFFPYNSFEKFICKKPIILFCISTSFVFYSILSSANEKVGKSQKIKNDSQY